MYGIHIQHRQMHFEHIKSYSLSCLQQIEQPHLKLQYLNFITCSESSFQLSFTTYRARHSLSWKQSYLETIFHKLIVEIINTKVTCGTLYQVPMLLERVMIRVYNQNRQSVDFDVAQASTLASYMSNVVKGFIQLAQVIICVHLLHRQTQVEHQYTNFFTWLNSYYGMK